MPMPPVSTNSKKRPPASISVATRSRVTPAVGSTMLIRRPASQLNSDDLPTFGRPTIATVGRDTGAASKERQDGHKEAQKARKEDQNSEFQFNLCFVLLVLFLW